VGVRVSKGELGVYRRHRPESTALYEVVRDNLETLWPKARLRALAPLTMGRLRCGSRNTRDRSFSLTSTAGFSAAASPG
jgi:hypothetical protein